MLVLEVLVVHNQAVVQALLVVLVTPQVMEVMQMEMVLYHTVVKQGRIILAMIWLKVITAVLVVKDTQEVVVVHKIQVVVVVLVMKAVLQ